MNKHEYRKLQAVCSDEPECHCPEEHEVLREIANTPEFIRRYFKYCT